MSKKRLTFSAVMQSVNGAAQQEALRKLWNLAIEAAAETADEVASDNDPEGAAAHQAAKFIRALKEGD